jgi:sialate O-acetylesterase
VTLKTQNLSRRTIVSIGTALMPFFTLIPALNAQVTLNPLFSDHMVLQRNHPIPVWGQSSPGKAITVALNGSKASAIADDTGAWHVSLSALPAGGPFSLQVDGDGHAEVADILIGEVWLASGQSNMKFEMGRVLNARDEIAKANDPSIRMFIVSAAGTRDYTHPQTTVEGKWKIATPETVPDFSAVAWYFARHLRDSLHVPVGIVESAVGGTPVEAWTSYAALSAEPLIRDTVKTQLEDWTNQDASKQTYRDAISKWEKTNNVTDPKEAIAPYTTGPTTGWKSIQLPAKSADLGLKGGAVVWFRRDIDLNVSKTHRSVTLTFGRLPEYSVLYVNGKKAGYYDPLNSIEGSSLHFTIAPDLLHDGPNTFALRVFAHTLKTAIFGSGNLLIDQDTPTTLKGTWLYTVTYEAPKLSTEIQDQLPKFASMNSSSIPTVLFNRIIAPLSNFAVRGILWYQGEQNVGHADMYRKILPLMITDWRKQWDEQLPFYLVQLPNLGAKSGGPNSWAWMRDAQAAVATSVPNSGYVVTIDVGDSSNLHPPNKKPVGDRLSELALAKTYGEKIESSGPTPDAFVPNGHTLRIHFAHTDDELKSVNGPLSGFIIAGADQAFIKADAVIEGDTVLVSAPSVSKPVAVRYGWSNNPIDANLYNKANLPTGPFRSDNWDQP